MTFLSILLIILSNSVNLRRDKSILFSRVTIIILIYACLISLNSLYLTYLGKGIGLYGGLFQVTATTHVFHIFIFILSSLILQLTSFYPRKVWVSEYSSLFSIVFSKFYYYKTKILNKTGEQFEIIEYPLILLFIITGAAFLVSTGDLVSIFLSIELQSYGLYLLSTIYRNSEFATEAGITYFLLGGLSSCFILLGTGLLYANSGTTSLDGIYVITSLFDITKHETLYIHQDYYINFSLLIMAVGFLFKISAAPFHFWSPAVYDAIPTIVTTFVAIIGKISIFVFFLELVHYTNNSFFSFKFSWTYGLLMSSLLSLIIGTLVGLTQYRIKRLFTYSTISHVGFILLALSINSLESIQAFIFYLIQYSISNLNAFIILVSIGFSYYCFVNETKKIKILLDKNNSPIQLISQIKGYFFINPILALSLTITIFSLVGIPPLIGFFGKQMVLSAALDNGYFFISLIAIVTSVISAAYYLGIIKYVFFRKSVYKLDPVQANNYFKGTIITNNNSIKNVNFNHKNIILSNYLTITISILTIIITMFILSPQQLLSITNILALIMIDS